MAIEPGKLVRLKSGGPKMTVDWVEDDMACCSWFEKNDRKQDRFYLATLEEVDSGGPQPQVRTRPLA